MRIGLYIAAARHPKPTGIGLHVRNLLLALGTVDHDNEYLLYFPAGLLRSNGRSNHLRPGVNFRLRPLPYPDRWTRDHPRLWWDYYLPHVLKHDAIDLFHGPNHFLPSNIRLARVVTVHDVAFLKMSLYAPVVTETMRHWILKALESADAIIAVSENTRADLEALGTATHLIHVIHGGANIVPEDRVLYPRSHEVRRRLRLPDRYILFVGTIHPRKNVPFLLRSYAALRRDGHISHGLVLAGHRGPASEEVDQLIGTLGLQGSVVVTDYLEDWEVPLLYKMADLFVLPSVYEGFTLVTLEALAYGVPLIAADTSSIREGVADACLLVPVGNDRILADTMRLVLTDDALRARLVLAGRTQAAKFSWERNAQATVDLYRQVSETYSRHSTSTAAR